MGEVTIDLTKLRHLVPIVVGTIAVIVGLIQRDAAVLTIGAGLVGFTPASQGPSDG